MSEQLSCNTPGFARFGMKSALHYYVDGVSRIKGSFRHKISRQQPSTTYLENTTLRYTKLMLAVPVLLGLSAVHVQAAGLTITANFDSTWSADANFATDKAAIESLITNVYEARYTNPITVALDFSDVNTGLGSSLTGYSSSSYNTYRDALTVDKQIANGGDGKTAFLSNLPATGNPVPGNSTSGVQFTSAQGRVLGFNTPGDVTVGTGTYDSQISLNVAAFPTTDNGAALAATAAHEINEALGLGSALDGRADLPGTPTLNSVGSLDFFRYAAIGNNTTANPTPTTGRSFTSSGSAVSYFSDDGGTTPIVFFNQVTGGDYHDWASNGEAFDGPQQVQDAFGPTDAKPATGPAEFEALNDVGYNTKSPVPEASSSVSFGLMLALGLGGFAIVRKRKAGKASA